MGFPYGLPARGLFRCFTQNSSFSAAATVKIATWLTLGPTYSDETDGWV
jgi:hypothetical protein